MVWRMATRHLAPTVSALLVLACNRATPPPVRAARAPGVMARGESQLKPGLRVRWLGGPTATLERGDLRVLTDPMLGPRGDNAFTLPKHPSSGALNAPVARYTELPAWSSDGLTAILIS